MIERVDFAFSYWILLWYGLYELHIVPYNPKFALLLAMFENLICLLLMVYYSYIHIGSFLVINFFVKVLPYYRVMHTTYTRQDVYASILLFCVYCGWLVFHRTSFPELIWTQIQHIKKDLPVGPFMYRLKSD